MKQRILLYMLFTILSAFALEGCKKENGFLNAKTDESLSVPTSLTDFKSLLINENLFNNNAPVLGTITANDYYLTSDTWANIYTNTERNAYIWAKDLYQGGNQFINDWNFPYQQVYVANTVLDGLKNISQNAGNQLMYNQVKGTALFFRAFAFYNLVQTFAMPYDPATAATDLGIPLRLTSDLNIKSVRATEAQCYAEVIADLGTAASLLPATTPIATQPNVLAANAMLARVYLGMNDFKNALVYADKSLSQNHTLVDLNDIVPETYSLSSQLLDEDIFHVCLTNSDATSLFDALIDPALYDLYDDNDLRKTDYFFQDGGIRDRSSYDYQGLKFSGLAIDELYLIRAESYARNGDTNDALADLNALLIKRYVSGKFIPVTAASANDALSRILTERRKELIFRGLRWTDLRRLNKETRFQVTLSRVVNNQTYTLPPNDPRYAMQIPPVEISLSGIQQNTR